MKPKQSQGLVWDKQRHWKKFSRILWTNQWLFLAEQKCGSCKVPGWEARWWRETLLPGALENFSPSNFISDSRGTLGKSLHNLGPHGSHYKTNLGLFRPSSLIALQFNVVYCSRLICVQTGKGLSPAFCKQFGVLLLLFFKKHIYLKYYYCYISLHR